MPEELDRSTAFDRGFNGINDFHGISQVRADDDPYLLTVESFHLPPETKSPPGKWCFWHFSERFTRNFYIDSGSTWNWLRSQNVLTSQQWDWYVLCVDLPSLSDWMKHTNSHKHTHKHQTEGKSTPVYEYDVDDSRACRCVVVMLSGLPIRWIASQPFSTEAAFQQNSRFRHHSPANKVALQFCQLHVNTERMNGWIQICLVRFDWCVSELKCFHVLFSLDENFFSIVCCFPRSLRRCFIGVVAVHCVKW